MKGMLASRGLNGASEIPIAKNQISDNPKQSSAVNLSSKEKKIYNPQPQVVIRPEVKPEAKQ
jgi:hypothetical protein